MEPNVQDGMTRRAFVIYVGAAAALLSSRWQVLAQQTSPAPFPGKEKLIVRSPRPINLETPLREITSDITPNELFFVRTNYDASEIDPAQYVLRVDGEVDNPLALRAAPFVKGEFFIQTWRRAAA